MDIFQRNWEALRATRPALAAQMESMLPDPRYYRLIETPSGVPSLELTNAEGKTTLWHSRYEPIREVQRELQALDHSRIYVPLFGGLGLGYGLRALWNNYRDEFFDAIVLEPDPSIFRLAMQVTRLDDLFADPRLHLHLGTDLDAWAELVRRIIPAIMSSTVQYIPHRPSQQNHSPFFASALASLHQRIQLTQAEFDLMIKSGARIQDNLWDNLPRIVSSIGLSQVRGLLEGKPAIVIAAGPSLDKNVHRLRGQEHRFTLIAVDTAYRTLKQQGIDPHIVVTTDPTELNARHFEGIKPAPHTLLAFDPEVYSTIPISWPFRDRKSVV